MPSAYLYKLVGIPPPIEYEAEKQEGQYLFLGPLIDPILWILIAVFIVICICVCAQMNYARQQRNSYLSSDIQEETHL